MNGWANYVLLAITPIKRARIINEMSSQLNKPISQNFAQPPKVISKNGTLGLLSSFITGG